MLSDDDKPLRAKAGSSTANGSNGHVATYGNELLDESSVLSEEDDVPLVCPLLHVAHVSRIATNETTQSQTTRTKSEPVTPDAHTLKRKKAATYTSSSEDDTPLMASSPAKNAKSAAVPMPGALEATTVPHVNGNGKAAKGKKVVKDSDDSDDDAPIAKKQRAAANKEKRKPPKKRVKKEESDADDDVESEDDKPIAKKAAPVRGKRKMKEESDADEDEDDKPLKKAVKKTPQKKVKKEEFDEDTPKVKKKGNKVKEEPDAKKGKKKSKEEEEEDTYKWWEQQEANGDGTEKWQTLEHNGVYFPPAYEPLPKNVKMKYNGDTLFMVYYVLWCS